MDDKKSYSEMAEKLKGLFGEKQEKEIDALLKVFGNTEFNDSIEKALDVEFEESTDPDEIYNDLADCYFGLLQSLNVGSFTSFKFPDYEDCRRVIVNDKEYDFDSEFSPDDCEATEILCGIDCLIADLGEDSISDILKELEKIINTQIKNT